LCGWREICDNRRHYFIIRKRRGGREKMIIKDGFNYQEKVRGGEKILIINSIFNT
jgi:hypothetical protein